MDNKITIGTKIVSGMGLTYTVVNIELFMFDYDPKIVITYNNDWAMNQPHLGKVSPDMIASWLKHGQSKLMNEG